MRNTEWDSSLRSEWHKRKRCTLCLYRHPWVSGASEGSITAKHNASGKQYVYSARLFSSCHPEWNEGSIKCRMQNAKCRIKYGRFFAALRMHTACGILPSEQMKASSCTHIIIIAKHNASGKQCKHSAHLSLLCHSERSEESFIKQGK